jgi:rare lipoprotein A
MRERGTAIASRNSPGKGFAMKTLIFSVTAYVLLLSSACAGSGMASHYSELSRTASGRSFRPTALVAAHRSLPFGTRLRVRNMRNGRSVIVTIVDRGPFVKGRVLDLSDGAAKVLGFAGLQSVEYDLVGR